MRSTNSFELFMAVPRCLFTYYFILKRRKSKGDVIFSLLISGMLFLVGLRQLSAKVVGLRLISAKGTLMRCFPLREVHQQYHTFFTVHGQEDGLKFSKRPLIDAHAFARLQQGCHNLPVVVSLL